jgi:nitrogen fixation protein NifT
MKVTLHTDRDGNLMIYVPKKDLEEPVVSQSRTDDAHLFTLSNGWELSITGLEEPIKMPKTVNARKLN